MTVSPKRLMYFGYYLRGMDWPLLAKFMAYVQTEQGLSKSHQWRAIFRDSLRFNISPLEYYQFRFFELTDDEKETWAGTGTMYEFQRAANPPATRELLRDKRLFYRAYQGFFRHELYSLAELVANVETLEKLLAENSTLVFKEATGNCGAGVSIQDVAGKTPAAILAYMHSHDFDVVETYVRQHPDMNSLSPSGVNTVRVFTQINSAGDYEVLGCRLRISVDSPVDNLAAGNMAAPVEEATGVVNGPGVFADITREPLDIHPVTGHKIVGFRIPYWSDTLEMVRDASLLHPENRSIGWDVVITEEGPGLIEGNHDWCKLVWQLPVNQGLLNLLDPGICIGISNDYSTSQ